MFDCHMHLTNGILQYDRALVNSGNVIFNSVEEYRLHNNLPKDFRKTVIFDCRNDFDFVSALVRNGDIDALKIHTRIQKLTITDGPLIVQSYKDIGKNIPVIFDAFSFGLPLRFQPDIALLEFLMKNLPGTKFVVAHAGGYKVLEYFFHFGTNHQVGFDLSLSLQFLRDSSKRTDLKKLIQWVSPDRLFWGSDLPTGNQKEQWCEFKAITEELSYSKVDFEKIVSTSWLDFVC